MVNVDIKNMVRAEESPTSNTLPLSNTVCHGKTVNVEFDSVL
jgi:hypothetical protein